MVDLMVSGSASDTFASIRLADVPGFVAAQLLGATAATGLFFLLLPASRPAIHEIRLAAQQDNPRAD
jgi:glycerol uptake facilitator-like aquaporin